MPVQHGPPAAALSQARFLLSAVPSGQAGLASGLDGTCTTATVTSVEMTSPLENLYPDTAEPVFAQPSPVSTGEQTSHTLPVSASYVAPETTEEGELFEVEDQPDVDTGDSDRAISEDQNYRETVRGVHAFMGWTQGPRWQSGNTLASHL